MNVSIFNRCKYYDSDSTTEQVIAAIRNGEVKEQVIALRQLLAEGKIEEYGKKKKLLPGFTVSGTFRNGRKAENLHQYNASIVIDIDKLSPALLLQAEAKAAKAPKKQKLNSWIDGFVMVAPTGMNEDETAIEILEKFEAFKKWAKTKIETV